MPLWEGPGAQAPGLQGRRQWQAAVACAGAAASVGLLVLVGWAVDIRILKSVAYDWVSMQPLTALCLLLAGVALSLGLLERWLLQTVAVGMVALIAGTALFEHLAGTTIPGLDTAMFASRIADQPLKYPGRMAEVTAVELLLFAAATMLARVPRTLRAARFLSALGLLIAVTGAVGYLFGAHRLAQMGAHVAIAAHTAAAMALLFTGCLLTFPAGAWLRALAAPRTGGQVARHLLAMVLGFPLVVGVVVEGMGQSLDAQPAFRMAVAMLGISVGLLFFVLWTAVKLNASDEQAEQATNAARTAETRLRAVIDTAVDAMVVIDTQGTMQSFNKAAEHIFGYAAEEAIGQNVSMLMTASDTSCLDACRLCGLAQAVGLGREVHGLRKDGAEIQLELSVAEWRDGDQRFFTGIMRDVTARKRTEEALAASEARFRAIFEQAAVGIALLQLDGQIVEVNQKLCLLLGYSHEELLQMTFDEITDPIDLIAEHRLLQEMLSGMRDTYSIEKRYVCKNGARVWVRVTSSLEQSADHMPRRRISVTEDLREQKEATAALHDTAARLQFALHGANAGMWDWNMADDTLMWTDEVYALTGLDRSAPASYNYFLTALVPEDRSDVDNAIHDIIARRDQQFRLVLRVRHPVKGLRWLSSIGRVSYRDDGSPLRMSGITMDISDLKHAEEEAERANQSKSRFLAAASHDLRQPVQALVLFTTALSTRLEGHPTAGVVKNMTASLDALQNLLEELLDISRLDAGVIAPKMETFALRDVIGRLATEYGLRAGEKGLELRVVKCRSRVTTDPTLLERIARNLIENAIRYTDKGRILIGCRRRGGRAILQVIDTGIGIPENQQESIFQEFYQVGNPSRDQSKGLGLGLSIVRRLAHLLGHGVTISSKPGKGTCFSIELNVEPRATVPPAAPATEPPAEETAGPGLVLVVDDEPMIRLGLSALFENWGWEVKSAGDCEEALASLDQPRRCPDVIVADYRLQHGRLGTEVIRRVQDACGRPVPAVIVTGDTAPDRIAEVTRSGFEIAHKPVVPRQLRRMIMHAVQKQAIEA